MEKLKPIDQLTEMQIKETGIKRLLEADGVKLSRRGNLITGKCPMHNDRHEGSFMVDEKKNICTCFAGCNKSWKPVNYVAERYFGYTMQTQIAEHYNEILRKMADILSIPVIESDGTQRASLPKKPIQPIVEEESKPQIWWSVPVVVKPFKDSKLLAQDNLLNYLRGLPLSETQRERLDKAIINYQVGHYPTSGANITLREKVIWWYVNDKGQVTTGKAMRYLTNGHRDKADKPNWMHNFLPWDKDKYEWKSCLFGLHLMHYFKDATICLVESEKTALLCSAFSDMNKRLWMATGGMSYLKDDTLAPLMDAGRNIILYPDIDGEQAWRDKVAKQERLSKYPRLTFTTEMRKLWKEEDGPKADMADILIRMLLNEPEPSENPVYTEAKRALMIDNHPALSDLIDRMGLEIDN